MATLADRYEWLKQILLDNENGYLMFYKSEIFEYLQIDNTSHDDLDFYLNSRYNDFIKCNTYQDVELFVSKIISHLEMKNPVQDMLDEYFAQ